jgi:hypothetical protein
MSGEVIRCIDRPIVGRSCIRRIVPDSHQYESASTLRTPCAPRRCDRDGPLGAYRHRRHRSRGESHPCVVPVVQDIDPRPPRLTTVVVLVYAPVLVSLPILLLVAIMIAIPGGFIILLAGLYWALSSLIGLVGLAATRRWRAHRARVRTARADVAPVRPGGQPRCEPAGAFASTQVPLALGNRRGEVSAANVSVARRAKGVPQLGPAELGPIRNSDDRRHAA